MSATPTKTSPVKYIILTLFHFCYFVISLTGSTSTETANYPGTKLVVVAFQVKKENEQFTVVCSCPQQYLEFGHFMLLF